MKRRTFLSTLTALIAAPALPATAAPAALGKHFATAKLLARCHDRASPAMLGRLMKLDAQTAQGVFRMLQERNVIASGLDGVARAINPLNTHCVPNEALRARSLAGGFDIKTRVQKLAQRHLKAEATPDEEADVEAGHETLPSTPSPRVTSQDALS